jgi:hypothetical protein
MVEQSSKCKFAEMTVKMSGNFIDLAIRVLGLSQLCKALSQPQERETNPLHDQITSSFARGKRENGF